LTRSTTVTSPRSFGSTTSAPYDAAISRRLASGSTATISAPVVRPAASAARPTDPAPNTTTLCSAVGAATLSMVPTPVWNPQP
jgi:hypothetical protein